MNVTQVFSTERKQKTLALILIKVTHLFVCLFKDIIQTFIYVYFEQIKMSGKIVEILGILL